ncbi:uncharacterized protein YneR [Streptohalobacillus salinus]|uniref:Uncharacterized protein YneR n=1 Tax=Streptohalobacillus salinus TaxID=621096 RepID=A0A2V3WFW8_9BACI|nr:HesB/YadR/YfhF family protein [Streptohalobacillus salinus]PXW92176.1 uncharacterized protein YneR [Streptohalobacillus salinus]
MNITVTQPALSWLIKELDLVEGRYIRFYVRYSGRHTSSGFSLGMTMNDEPFDAITEITFKGITFFIEKKDAWYFDGHDLKVKYTRKADEIVFVLT